ncbi:MAG TPA: hypothetical protein VFW94_11555 [Candidatus Acidoferrales bacterium]|nr:hypothetical protein [Candidatus Acidoferrales bacterium]
MKRVLQILLVCWDCEVRIVSFWTGLVLGLRYLAYPPAFWV